MNIIPALGKMVLYHGRNKLYLGINGFSSTLPSSFELTICRKKAIRTELAFSFDEFSLLLHLRLYVNMSIFCLL
jgi:hypothetical protein